MHLPIFALSASTKMFLFDLKVVNFSEILFSYCSFDGWLREKYPERFGEVIDEKDRKAQVELK